MEGEDRGAEGTGGAGGAAEELEILIRRRRTVKDHRGDPVPRETLEELLELVVWAPNHRRTEPWAFRVLGPGARRRYGELLGDLRAAKVEDPSAGDAVRRKTVVRSEAAPAILAFLQRLDPDSAIREEDYAALWMGIQNLLLAASARGLVAQVKTGKVLEVDGFRTLVEAGKNERVVALVLLGRPLELPDPPPRIPARERTRWIP